MSRPRALFAALLVACLLAGAGLALGRDGTGSEPRTETESEARDYGVARVAPRLEGRLVDTIGVASFNAWRLLGRPGAKADWDRITGNPDIDLIGWQESKSEMARVHYRLLAQMFDEAEGDVVIGTGDYNWDYADDSEYRPAGGISHTVDHQAQSSYEVLGLDGVVPTQGSRWIDYIWLANDSVRRRDGSGTAQFARHRSLGGFASDHRPLLARIRLYGG